jgi:hypothetical protein
MPVASLVGEAHLYVGLPCPARAHVLERIEPVRLALEDELGLDVAF